MYISSKLVLCLIGEYESGLLVSDVFGAAFFGTVFFLTYRRSIVSLGQLESLLNKVL